MDILTLEQVRSLAPAAFTTTHAPNLSGRYQQVNTIKTIEPLLENGWHHIVALSREDLVYQDLQIEALFCNSHNGAKKYEIKLGAFKFVCSNGIITCVNDFEEVSIKHLYLPEVIADRSEQIIERAPKIIAKIDEWSQREVSCEEFAALNWYALGLRFPGYAQRGEKFPIENLSQCRRPEDMGNNLWLTFNRIQENLIRGGQAGKTRKGGNRKVSAIHSVNRNVQLNEGLWAAAEAIADGNRLFFKGFSLN
jgi:hypothetical protein